jgi:uncharacterized membrane protein
MKDAGGGKMQDAESRSRRWVHWTLIVGLVASALLLIAGAGLDLAKHEPARKSEPPRVVSMASRAVHGDGISIMQFGLLILMLTPVARVIVLGLDWLLERDRVFAGVAATVLVLLAISVVLGTG